MRKPKKVNILGSEYAIEYMDKACDVDYQQRQALWGQIDYWTRSIRIYDNPDQNPGPQETFATVLHEVLHGINEDLQLSCFDSNDPEKHKDMDRVSKMLADVLVRNDWVRLDDWNDGDDRHPQRSGPVGDSRP